MTRTAPLRRTTVCESAIAQVLAENLVCHPSLLRWLTRRTLADLSVDLANDGARVEFVGVHAEGDAGCDLKVVGDFGQIDIGFLISVRFSYRAAEARRAHEAARALSQSGETAYAVSVWVTSQAEIDRMTQKPVITTAPSRWRRSSTCWRARRAARPTSFSAAATSRSG